MVPLTRDNRFSTAYTTMFGALLLAAFLGRVLAGRVEVAGLCYVRLCSQAVAAQMQRQSQLGTRVLAGQAPRCQSRAGQAKMWRWMLRSGLG